MTWIREDGATIDEADLRAVARLALDDALDRPSVNRIMAALAPKPAPTCGAYIKVDHMEGPPNILRCVLPPGHHPFVRPINTCCTRLFDDPIHSPGHMPSADSWRER